MLACMADRATWTKRVAAWRASGLTAEKFAERSGCASKTLRWWAWRLERESRAFVRVVREEATARAPEPAPIVIEINGVRVLVPAEVDRGALRDVLAALRASQGSA